jgi:hypothetical protein
LQEKGALKREAHYITGVQAKKIKLITPPKQGKILMHGDEPAEGWEQSVQAAFNPSEYRALLQSVGVDYSSAKSQTQRLYSSKKDAN